jgi:hypothetical protein
MTDMPLTSKQIANKFVNKKESLALKADLWSSTANQGSW